MFCNLRHWNKLDCAAACSPPREVNPLDISTGFRREDGAHGIGVLPTELYPADTQQANNKCHLQRVNIMLGLERLFAL